MQDFKKLLAFFAVCAYALGTIGGVAYLFYFHKAPFAFAEIVVSALAFPMVRDAFRLLLGSGEEE